MSLKTTFMTTKVIEISGQRITFNTPTDYQTMFLAQIWDGDKIAIDRQKHSDFLCLLIEVIAPNLPKKLYKKTESGYWWLGTAAEFGEIWVQLEKICRETFPQYFGINEPTSEPTSTIESAPEQTIEEIRAELEALKAKIVIAA
jgi:hypothetical protein